MSERVKVRRWQDHRVRTEIKNRITMLQAQVVAEGTPSHPGRRAWLMLRAVDDGVNLVEAESPADVDPDDYLTPVQVLSHKEIHFANLEDAIQALVARGVDTEAFDVPWKSDCPF